ncbi:MAG: sugar porter family MFS transporter [Schleiferiaceae bacterium]|nr:sugar porter family MFS transporter [Schleiferiaceae bacterium]MDG1881467.1 sugar porter family MFS transporter [Schleiferiaceae bacterium]
MKNVQKWSWVVALAGFLFGFDTVVISGANEPIRELWDTSSWFHGTFIMSMALWGTVIGSLFGGRFIDNHGRKPILFLIGGLYLLSALGSALAWDPYSFSFFRFIGGVGVGASSVAAPAYISEISSSKNRGRLVALYQFNIVFGILLAFLSNYFLNDFGGEMDWRYMLGVEAIPAIVYAVFVLSIPESPRWLVIKKKNIEGARRVLMGLMEEKDVDQTLTAIQSEITPVNSTDKRSFFSRKYRFPIMLAFLLAMFNQLSGINFILYYAPSILENAGFATTDSLLSSVSIGGVNLLFTFVGLYFIDKAGRRSLMYLGSIGYILSLSLVAYGFYTDASAYFNLSFILLFIASHAVGQGAVIWVFISEIFPNSVRGIGQSLGTGTHWVFAALITLVGPVLLDSFPQGYQIFIFFAICMVAQLLFTHFIMPETKGKTLEELKSIMEK